MELRPLVPKLGKSQTGNVEKPIAVVLAIGQRAGKKVGAEMEFKLWSLFNDENICNTRNGPKLHGKSSARNRAKAIALIFKQGKDQNASQGHIK